MSNDRVRHIIELARQARLEGNFEYGFNIMKGELSKFPEHEALVWQHQTFFWSNIHAGSYSLTRRDSSDADFVESLWGDSNFRRRFHRQAVDLPPRVQLEKLLRGEFLSLIGESKINLIFSNLRAVSYYAESCDFSVSFLKGQSNEIFYLFFIIRFCLGHSVMG